MLNYYPEVIKSIREFQALIKTQSLQVEEMHEELTKILGDAYVSTASESKIAEWEHFLGITPLPQGEDDLETYLSDRRETILARLYNTPKLNTKSISDIVQIFTGGTATSSFKDGTIHVLISPPKANKQYKFENVEQELRKKIPAHLMFQVDRNYYNWLRVKSNYPTWGDVKNGFANWEDVLLFVPFERKYNELKYIESSGTQYIDTGFIANNNTRVVMDFELTGDNPSDVHALYGTRSSSTVDCYVFLWNGSKHRVYYGTNYNDIGTTTMTGRRVVDQNKETTLFDGETRTYENVDFTTPRTLKLFASDNGGTIRWNAYAKVYSCRIYDNDVLIRDYVPCTNLDGEVGLWDKVNDTFYGNAGTGEFIAGHTYS